MTDTAATGTIQFEHGKVTWELPADLLALQRRFFELDAECSRLALQRDQAGYDEASGRRLDVVLAKNRHPWVRERQADGKGFQADEALRAAARKLP